MAQTAALVRRRTVERRHRTVDPSRPALGAMAATIAMLPVVTPVGPGNSTPLDALILLAVGAAVYWAGTSGALLRAPYVLPVIAIAIVGCAAALAGTFPGAGLVAVLQDLYLYAWAFAVANLLRSPEGLSFALGAWALGAFLWSAVLVLAVVTGHLGLAGVGGDGTRAALTFGDQNGAAAYFALSFMIVLGAKQPRGPVMRAVAAGSILVALALTGSIAGLLGLVLGVGASVAFAIRRRWGTEAMVAAVVAGMLAAAGLIAAVSSIGLLGEASSSGASVIRDSIGRLSDSSAERREIDREASQLYVTGSVLGRGPNSTQSSLEAEQAPYPKEAHNDYIAAIVERGALGELAVLLLVGAIAARTLVVAKRGISRRFAGSVPAPSWLVGALAVFLVFSLTHETLHDHTFWTYFGLLAAIHLWARSPSRENTVAP